MKLPHRSFFRLSVSVETQFLFHPKDEISFPVFINEKRNTVTFDVVFLVTDCLFSGAEGLADFFFFNIVYLGFCAICWANVFQVLHTSLANTTTKRRAWCHSRRWPATTTTMRSDEIAEDKRQTRRWRQPGRQGGAPCYEIRGPRFSLGYEESRTRVGRYDRPALYSFSREFFNYLNFHLGLINIVSRFLLFDLNCLTHANFVLSSSSSVLGLILDNVWN